MSFNDGTLTCVLNGDWNKKYIDPQWISKELFQKDELEVTINTIGLSTNIVYKSGHISIKATQDKFVFIADDYSETALSELESSVVRFLEIASTPGVVSFGYNCEFISDDTSSFIDCIDNMADRTIYTGLGAEITNTSILQTILFEERTINVNEKLVGDTVVFDFNQHHDVKDFNKDIIPTGDIEEFVNRIIRIISAFGFDINEE